MGMSTNSPYYTPMSGQPLGIPGFKPGVGGIGTLEAINNPHQIQTQKKIIATNTTGNINQQLINMQQVINKPIINNGAQQIKAIGNKKNTFDPPQKPVTICISTPSKRETNEPAKRCDDAEAPEQSKKYLKMLKVIDNEQKQNDLIQKNEMETAGFIMSEIDNILTESIS